MLTIKTNDAINFVDKGELILKDLYWRRLP